MGVFDFLKKKPSVQPAAPLASAPTPMPGPSMAAPTNLDLPELPSFDAAPSLNASMDLPPLPSFDSAADIAPPASFSAPAMPEMPTLSTTIQPPSFPSQASAPAAMPAEPAVSVDVKTPFGPVFCDIETYRTILSNLNYAKDEVTQLQTFSENGAVLHSKTQAHYDAFHASLSSMAKKMLMAEAKLFSE